MLLLQKSREYARGFDVFCFILNTPIFLRIGSVGIDYSSALVLLTVSYNSSQ